MKRYGLWVEEVPTNATGTAVPGTGDDDSTVVVKKKPKIFKRKRRLTKEQLEGIIREGTYIFPILDSEGESERGAKQQLAKASKFGVKGKIVKDKYNDDGGSAVEVSGSPEDVIRWQWDMSPDEEISSSDVKDLEKNQGKSKYRGGRYDFGEELEEGIVKRAAGMAKDAAKKKAGELKKKAVSTAKAKLKSTGPARAYYGAKSKVKAAQDTLDKAKEKKKKMSATWKKLKGEETEDDLAELDSVFDAWLDYLEESDSLQERWFNRLYPSHRAWLEGKKEQRKNKKEVLKKTKDRMKEAQKLQGKDSKTYESAQDDFKRQQLAYRLWVKNFRLELKNGPKGWKSDTGAGFTKAARAHNLDYGKKRGKEKGWQTQSKVTGEARDYAKERENYHSKPEQMERNAARLRARRLMIKNGKAARGDGKDVHHKDNDPLNNEEDNLKVTDRSWNRREPRLRKEESINISERSLTDTELKRREEIAKDLDDAKFKEKYGDKWKQVKMGVATNLAKKESIDEVDIKKDPKADKELGKELKIKKAIAQAQLSIAKDAERVQKLNDLLTKKKEKQKTDESIMSEKYLDTKQGSIEDAIKQVWQNAADAVPATPPKVEDWSKDDEEEEVQPEKKSSKVDGRSKAYKETMKRIALRKEKLSTINKSAKKMEARMDGLEEDESLVREAEKHLDENLIKKAIEIARKHEDQMTIAVEKIEALKRGLSKHRKVADALQKYNEETIREAVAHFDLFNDKESQQWMKKSLRKHKLKGKITQRDVNQGSDEWEITGPLANIWKWYQDGYSDDDDYEDFMQTNVSKDDKGKKVGSNWSEDCVLHGLMMTEGSKEEYQKFFQAALKKFGVKSPAELEGEKKKSFFDYIDKNWTKEEQQDFSEGELPPALKKAIAAKKAKKNGDKEEDEDDDPVGDGEVEEGIGHSPKPRGGLDKAIDKFKKAGGKTTKLKPGGRLKGMDKRRKAVVKGRSEENEEEIKEVAAVDYTFTDNRGAKAAHSFARLWAPSARRGDSYDEDEFETEIFGSKKNQLSVDSGEDGDMEKLHNAIMKRYAKQITDHEVVAESRFIHEAKSPIDELRKIVDKKTAGKVSGMKVDLYSASAMVAVYNALNPQNQTKVEQMLKSKQGLLTFAEFAMSNVK